MQMFENYDEAAEKLRSRKSKILGGGVSEKMFLDKFVIPADLSYSKGWWLSKVGNDDRMFFFVVKDRLSAFDDTIKDILLSHGQKVYQIVCRENDFVIIADGETMTVEEFIRSQRIPAADEKTVPRNTGALIDRCIEFYAQNGLLHTPKGVCVDGRCLI